MAAEEQVVADFVWQSGEYLGSHLRHHTWYVAALFGKRVEGKYMGIGFMQRIRLKYVLNDEQ